MADKYTAYTDLYNYMNRILSEIQTKAGYQTVQTKETSSAQSDKSFYNTLKDAAKKLNAPASMDSIFEEAAAAYNVPLALLKAVGKAESGFNADAVSPAGAQGVMQLMPATAQALGVDNPFDARSNIMGGAKYIAEKLNEYNGDIELALAAYNAGSGNVSKYGGVPPFEETINYIKRIKEYMGMDLTTGQTVAAGGAGSRAEAADSTDSTDALLSARELTELTTQYIMGTMHLKLQNKMDSIGLSIASGQDEEEEEDRFL